MRQLKVLQPASLRVRSTEGLHIYPTPSSRELRQRQLLQPPIDPPSHRRAPIATPRSISPCQTRRRNPLTTTHPPLEPSKCSTTNSTTLHATTHTAAIAPMNMWKASKMAPQARWHHNYLAFYARTKLLTAGAVDIPCAGRSPRRSVRRRSSC